MMVTVLDTSCSLHARTQYVLENADALVELQKWAPSSEFLALKNFASRDPVWSNTTFSSMFEARS